MGVQRAWSVAAVPLAALMLAAVPANAQVRGTAPRPCAECDTTRMVQIRAALESELARVRAEIPRIERQIARTEESRMRRELVAQLQSLQRREDRLRFELQEVQGLARTMAGRSARIHVIAPRGYIGLNLEGSIESRSTPTGWATRYADLPEVVSVEPGSPAERAGVRAGDILLAVNGLEVKSADFMQRLEESLRPGNELVLRLRRGGGVHTVAARVETRPSHFREFTVVQGAPIGEGVRVEVRTPGASARAATGRGGTVVAAAPTPPVLPAGAEPPAPAPAPEPAPVVVGRAVIPRVAPSPIGISSRPYPLAGAELLAVNVELARKLGADRGGLLILHVGPQTPASRSGLRVGDLIVRLSEADDPTIERLQTALQRGDGRRGLELGVMRDGEPVTVLLRW